MILFLDTTIVAYRVEMPAETGPRVAGRLAALARGGHSFAISDLVRTEARMLGKRHRDDRLIALYEAFFAAANLRVLATTAAVCDQATRLRARHAFQPMGALQLAAAIVHGCDRFLTADARLSRCPDIPVDLLP